MIDESDPRLRYLSINDAIKPIDGPVYCYVDRYWIVHPSKGLVFYTRESHRYRILGSAQCNSNRDIADHLWCKLYPWAEVRFMPVVFTKLNTEDYR